jgi:hypothetical protein
MAGGAGFLRVMREMAEFPRELYVGALEKTCFVEKCIFAMPFVGGLKQPRQLRNPRRPITA